MEAMFAHCTGLVDLNMSNFDTSKVTNMNYFFEYVQASKLTLGTKFKFSGKNENIVQLPAINTENGSYTGKWQLENGDKTFASSDALVNNYTGATDAGTYIWQTQGKPVLVKYVDEKGVELAKSETTTGGLNETYTTEAKEIKGYELKETPANATGTFTEEAQTVTYVYQKEIQKWGTSPWTLEDGVLTIKSGNLGEGTTTATVAGIPKSEVKKIVFEGDVIAGKNASNQFREFTNVTSFEGMEYFDTTQTQDASFMFYNCSSLTDIDFSHFNTENVTTMLSIFNRCSSLTKIDISHFNTKNVTDMGYMFYKCSNLAKIDLSTFDTSKVTTMEGMFAHSTGLVDLNMSNFDTSKVTNMNYFFEYVPASKLTLGTKFKFSGKNENNVQLPAINTENGSYTGKWQLKNGDKTFASSDALVNNYSGATDAGTYIWQGVQGEPVVVKYVDEKGVELAKSETVTGILNETYTTEAKTIKNYELKETPANATGTFTKATQTVTYVYEATQGAPVTVNYVDTKGNTIADSDVLTGKFGTSFESKAKEIAGYELKETPENATGIYTDEAQSVTYVYQAVEGEAITVNYVDTEGKVLDTETLTGKFNENYTTEAKNIEGYTLKTTPKNATGVFTLESQTVTYVYTASVGAPVTVRYINQLGNEIAAATTLNGKVGQTVTATAKTPGGYTLISDSTTQEATIGTAEQTITFEYQGNAASKLTIDYVDTDGVRIAPVKTISGGNVGDAYTTEAETIQGYTLQTTPENASGFRTQGAMTVTYVYKKDAAKPFAVNYVGVQQQKVVGFVPEGVTTSKVSLMIKKDGTNEWVDTGYTATPAADTGYFAIESRFVKDTRDFLLNNKDQIKVVFTAENGDNYEGIQVVQPYTAPVANDFTEGDEYLTGSVPNGANQVRVSINGNLMRVVNNGPLIADDAGIDAVTGAFSIWAKTWCEGAYGSSPIQQTKTGDVITVDYGVQIYGAFNNPSTTIIVK